MIKKAAWIEPSESLGDICPLYVKRFYVKKDALKKATLFITAAGIYEVFINGKRVSDYIFAPGWTDYTKRLQYQTYDVTPYLDKEENEMEVLVSSGWYCGSITREKKIFLSKGLCLIAYLDLGYADGSSEAIQTDISWRVKKSKVLFADIYDGEVYDANFESDEMEVQLTEMNKSVLIPQEGELIKEQEVLAPVETFVTPKGERVVDFGQEITGYVSFEGMAKKGEKLRLSFAEVMDKDGNFYTENYREAKCKYEYICKDGMQYFKPQHTFYGFRYVRIDEAPAGMEMHSLKAIVVHSDMKRTGYLKTDHPLLNKLFENIIWGQKGNFLDVPTDCPQRNERLGWTGDAQVFIKTATYQYDVLRFFRKWLRDMQSEQRFDGFIPHKIPTVHYKNEINSLHSSAAWSEAAVIIPWHLYQTYGDTSVLSEFLPMMEKWISFVEENTNDAYMRTGCWGFGDWLGLDAEDGSYVGATRFDIIGSAYYKYTTEIIGKIRTILNMDAEPYFEKARRSRRAFIEKYQDTFHTQTECVLALFFDLTDEKEKIAVQLNQMITDNGMHLTTGFVGTPYLLFALSRNGYTDTAYALLLQEDYPSWLYSVKKGATTIWEHWDGLKPDGSFWSADMNSFNHYAYGSVAQWVYEEAAGIRIIDNELEISPKPCRAMGSLRAEFHWKEGRVVSSWAVRDGRICYEMEVPVACRVIIDGIAHQVEKGKHSF